MCLLSLSWLASGIVTAGPNTLHLASTFCMTHFDKMKYVVDYYSKLVVPLQTKFCFYTYIPMYVCVMHPASIVIC